MDRRVFTVVLGLVFLACDGAVEPTTDTGASESDSTGGEAPSGSTASGTSGAETTEVDPDLACGRFQDRFSCPDRVGDTYCGWISITPVSLEDGACVLSEDIGRCVPLSGGSTADGCVGAPGCDSDPYSIDLQGQLGAFFHCGGSPPIGSQPCVYVEPGVYEPAACACICDGVEGPGNGSSGEATTFSGTTT